MLCSISDPARSGRKGIGYPKALAGALVVLYLTDPPVARAGTAEVEWELGASHQYFHYEETLPNGRSFNTEKGWLPGIYASAKTSLPRDVQLTARISRAKGSADYEGATQASQALSTETTETLTRASLELSAPLPGLLPESLSAVVDVSYNRWNRKIQPTRSSSHLFEHYRWLELSGGLRHCTKPVTLSGIEQLCVMAKLTRSDYGSVTVRLEQVNLGSPELDLGGDWGGEASMKLTFEGSLTLRLYTKTWNHAASQPVFIQKASQTIRIKEPASQSWLTGFEAGLRF